MAKTEQEKLAAALWRIYNRPERPSPWTNGGNLPWDDPAFSERMLREHLDESHGAASRPSAERAQQVTWLWSKLALTPGAQVLDVTCGPGLYATALAQQGCRVTGIDFGPAAIAHARQLAQQEGVDGRCRFIRQDVRRMEMTGADFDAALFLYGQLAVFPKEEAWRLLSQIAGALKPGGLLCVELLNPAQVDKKNSTWWFTDDTRLWGDAPFLHLGERFWYAEQQLSLERFSIIHLDSGRMDEVILCDQVYEPAEMKEMMRSAGFTAVAVYPAWEGLILDDADEWLVYIAQK